MMSRLLGWPSRHRNEFVTPFENVFGKTEEIKKRPSLASFSQTKVCATICATFCVMLLPGFLDGELHAAVKLAAFGEIVREPWVADAMTFYGKVRGQ